MFDRLATPVLHAAAEKFPVVAILGARQAGKTTLARSAFPDFEYLDLEDPRTAERFRDDARFALERAGGAGLILDEAQAVPGLFAALRGAVDAHRTVNGRFVRRRRPWFAGAAGYAARFGRESRLDRRPGRRRRGARARDRARRVRGGDRGDSLS